MRIRIQLNQFWEKNYLKIFLLLKKTNWLLKKTHVAGPNYGGFFFCPSESVFIRMKEFNWKLTVSYPVKKPESYSFTEAAALPMSALVAYGAVKVGNLQI